MRILGAGTDPEANTLIPLSRDLATERYQKSYLDNMQASEPLYILFDTKRDKYRWGSLDVIEGIYTLLTRSEFEMQTALYFLEKFYGYNKSQYQIGKVQGKVGQEFGPIKITVKDSAGSDKMTDISISISSRSDSDEDRKHITIYKDQRPIHTLPQNIAQTLSQKLQTQKPSIQNGTYNIYDLAAKGIYGTGYQILTNTSGEIICITMKIFDKKHNEENLKYEAYETVVPYFFQKEPNLEGYGSGFISLEEIITHKVARSTFGVDREKDLKNGPGYLFTELEKYLAA